MVGADLAAQIHGGSSLVNKCRLLNSFQLSGRGLTMVDSTDRPTNQRFALTAQPIALGGVAG